MSNSEHPTASAALWRKGIMSGFASVALLTTLSACNDREGRMLALASISRCSHAQPTLDALMQQSQQPYSNPYDVGLALAVIEECSDGAKKLRKYYPDHACLPFMDSAVKMAELAHNQFSGGRPITSADRSAGRLAQNRAACLASHPGLMGG